MRGILSGLSEGFGFCATWHNSWSVKGNLVTFLGGIYVTFTLSGHVAIIFDLNYVTDAT
jgi:hypothetical protein